METRSRVVGGGAQDVPYLIDEGLAIGGAAAAVGVDFPVLNFTGPATATGLLLARAARQIRAEGTAPIARVDIIRDNAYVFSNEPNARKMSLQYSDDEAQPGQSHYYYVRIRQADGNLAWGSPMWINVRKK